MNTKFNYYEIDGKRYVDMLPPGVEVICDFCSTPEPPFRNFSAEDIEIDPGNVSEGGWMACKDCEALIDSNNLAGLKQRIVETFREKFGSMMEPDELSMATDLILEKFMRGRTLFRISEDIGLLGGEGK